MDLAEALVALYQALIKHGFLILDLTAEPNNYNSPVSKAASLMDNCTFYRFSKICELFPSLIDYFSLLSFTFITLILIFLSYGYQVKI
jgi:hypothetical protein